MPSLQTSQQPLHIRFTPGLHHTSVSPNPNPQNFFQFFEARLHETKSSSFRSELTRERILVSKERIQFLEILREKVRDSHKSHISPEIPHPKGPFELLLHYKSSLHCSSILPCIRCVHTWCQGHQCYVPLTSRLSHSRLKFTFHEKFVLS